MSLARSGLSNKPNPFSGIKVVSRLCMNVSVLLTFGLGSPLLAVAVCVDSITTYIVWNAWISRYTSFHDDRYGLAVNLLDSVSAGGGTGSVNLLTAATPGMTALSRATEDTVTGVGTVLWMIVIIAGSFWGLFVFDMFGDIYNPINGSFMIIAPFCGGLCCYFYSRQLFSVGPRPHKKCPASVAAEVHQPVLEPQSINELFEDKHL
jgi:hypothetical protein